MKICDEDIWCFIMTNVKNALKQHVIYEISYNIKRCLNTSISIWNQNIDCNRPTFSFQTRKSDCEKKNKRPRNVYIGNSHTVSGHEASDLAKRLSEELAIHQQSVNRSTSPDYEIRPRSLEQKHYKKTGKYLDVRSFW